MEVITQSHLAPQAKVPGKLNTQHPSIVVVADIVTQAGEIFRVNPLCVAQNLISRFSVDADDSSKIPFIFTSRCIYSKIVAVIFDRRFPLEDWGNVVGFTVDVAGAGARV